MYSLLILTISSFLLALLLTPLVRNFSVGRGWVDTPDGGRKSHRIGIPRTGGVAILLAYVGAFGILLAIGLRGTLLVDLELVMKVAPAVGVIFLVGLIDDIVGLKAWQKLIGQLIAAGVAFASGIHVHIVGYHTLPGWLELPATIIWLVMITNAVNLIDGMDGLATGVALFATLTMLVAGLQSKLIPLAMALVPLAGALLGFLRYNFNPATVFLGDCGSLTIGFVLGCMGIFWSQKSATMLGVTAPLLALAIPLLDSVMAVIRRFLRRQPIFGADRGHVHHRLLDRGLSVRQAAVLLYGVSLVFAILSLASSVLRDSYAGVVLVLFGAVTWIGVQSLGYVEINMAGRLLLGGGFRRMLVGQLIIRHFEEDLRGAKDHDAVWEVVRGAARELGFERVAMQYRGKSFTVHFSDSTAEEWTVDVPIGAGDYVRLTRPFGLNTHQAAMGPFLDTLRKELCANSLPGRSGGKAQAARVD
jgi:UDP-GlcNAc:undecaprenyl-phosphate GlcNAc-1-phosphate transferase